VADCCTFPCPAENVVIYAVYTACTYNIRVYGFRLAFRISSAAARVHNKIYIVFGFPERFLVSPNVAGRQRIVDVQTSAGRAPARAGRLPSYLRGRRRPGDARRLPAGSQRAQDPVLEVAGRLRESR